MSVKISRVAGLMSITLSITIVVWLYGFGLFIQHVRHQQPEKVSQATDAIIVLTGGAQRVNTGLDLLSTGQGKKLFISGVNGQSSLHEIMALWKRPITAQDKNDCCIVLDHRARNTVQNAREAQSWAQKEQIKSIRLVTSDYHMPRSQIEFRKRMPGIEILTYPVKSQQKSNRKNFIRFAFGEYNKTILTFIKVYMLPEKMQPLLESRP